MPNGRSDNSYTCDVATYGVPRDNGAMPIETLQHNRITWTNITQPTPEDVDYLREEYPHFHPLDLEDILSTIERPKLDEYDDYLFLVLQFPVWDPIRLFSRPSEVDIFVGSGYVITVHDGKHKPIEQLFRQCQENEGLRDQLMNRGASRVFYAIIDTLVDYLFPMLYKIDAKIRHLEEAIFIENARDVLKELAVVRRDIISMRRIVRPQIEIVENLERIDRAYIREELDVYFGDILDHLNKAIDLIVYHSEIVFGLTDTTNILANLYTNEIMRILTLISVIMLPLTLLSGIYGMNIVVPFQHHPFAFGIVIGIMVLIAAAMLYYFRRRGWL
ncbi:MAG: magnesium/cobalt transporter CorA [Anaerolineales bacterium]|nr:magnesium/cobalt transporter CorA [Anaerolineales bacterium]